MDCERESSLQRKHVHAHTCAHTHREYLGHSGDSINIACLHTPTSTGSIRSHTPLYLCSWAATPGLGAVRLP